MPQPAGSQITILIAEDQPQVRGIMARTLEQEGYRVLKAQDGMQALELLSADPSIRLVVADIVMPRMDGFELAQEVASTTRARVLFVSGYGRERTENLPGPLLMKPFSPTALTGAVGLILATRDGEEVKIDQEG